MKNIVVLNTKFDEKSMKKRFIDSSFLNKLSGLLNASKNMLAEANDMNSKTPFNILINIMRMNCNFLLKSIFLYKENIELNSSKLLTLIKYF